MPASIIIIMLTKFGMFMYSTLLFLDCSSFVCYHACGGEMMVANNYNFATIKVPPDRFYSIKLWVAINSNGTLPPPVNPCIRCCSSLLSWYVHPYPKMVVWNISAECENKLCWFVYAWDSQEKTKAIIWRHFWWLVEGF